MMDRWIPTSFCTCHDSAAVLPCAKNCNNVISRNGITVKWNFCWILLTMDKTLVKCAPGHHNLQTISLTIFLLFDENFFLLSSKPYKLIATKFSTWYYSFAILACRKICSNFLSRYRITAKDISPNLNCDCEIFNKMGLRRGEKWPPCWQNGEAFSVVASVKLWMKSIKSPFSWPIFWFLFFNLLIFLSKIFCIISKYICSLKTCFIGISVIKVMLAIDSIDFVDGFMIKNVPGHWINHWWLICQTWWHLSHMKTRQKWDRYFAKMKMSHMEKLPNGPLVTSLFS